MPNKAKTSFGTANKITKINNTDKKSITGPWQGKQWSLEDFNLEEGKMSRVKIALGQPANQQTGILYFDSLVVNSKKSQKENNSLVLYFPIQGK